MHYLKLAPDLKILMQNPSVFHISSKDIWIAN